jgi:type I restriction enzyme S subunit
MKQDNELPLGWKVTKISYCCEILRGVTYKKEDSSKESKSDFLPILRATNIQDNKIITDSDLVFVHKSLISKNQLLKIGDIVVATSSGSKHLVGKTAQLKENWQGSIGAFCAIIRHNVEINNKYLGYFFNSPEYKEYIAKKSVGVNINNLRRDDFENISIPLAPFKEQHRIVTEIEKQFSRLDETVSALKRIQANLKRYKASVLKSAVEGKLTAVWREQHPALESAQQLLERILKERRAHWEAAELAKMEANGKPPKDEQWKLKYKEPVKPDISMLPELPAGWVWACVEQLAQVETGATPLRSKNEYYENGSINWITSGALNDLFIRSASDLITELAIKETNVKVFPENTILIAMYGEGKTRGKVSELLIKAATNQACAALLFNGISKRVKDYGKLFFRKNYDDIRNLSSGGVQPNLNLGIIKSSVIPLPPLAEQTQIVAEVEKRLSVAEEVEQQINRNLKRAEHLRQAILKRAFSGKLVPQNPADEPASVLLEKLNQTSTTKP